MGAATGSAAGARAAAPVVVVLACGDDARGDDAAGLAVVELLAPATRAGAQVLAVGQLDVQTLLDLPAGAGCVIADAVAGIAPGEAWVRPLEALAERARRLDASGRRPEPRSSHELPLDATLALAATLRGSAPRGTFVGIGGASFALGAALSPAVAAALPAFAAAIDAAVAELARPR